MKVVTRYIECIKTDIEYVVGKDAADNFKILYYSGHDDIWFHVDGTTSAHVIAKIPTGRSIDKKHMLRIIKQGAVICKEVSKYASCKKLRIVFASVNDVMPTEKVGTVIVSKAKYLDI